MRRVQRQALSLPTASILKALTDQVQTAPNPRSTAQALWHSKPVQAFSEIRACLSAMASGRSRCMYCEDSQGTDIEHFWPKKQYPERAFVWDNYLLACSTCNSNLKREKFPLKQGNPLLIDPSAEDPADHLVFLPSTGAFEGTSDKGRASIDVFGLNDDTSPRKLPTGRRGALLSLIALLILYDQEKVENPERAGEIRATVQEYPFSAVLHWLVRIAETSAGPIVLGQKVVNLLHIHKVETWL